MSSCSALETRSFLKIILKKGMFMKFVRYIANVKLLLALHLCTESKQVRAKQCPTMVCITFNWGILGWGQDCRHIDIVGVVSVCYLLKINFICFVLVYYTLNECMLCSKTKVCTIILIGVGSSLTLGGGAVKIYAHV